jgi:electron transfer flavoprotein beta subunit
MTVVACLHPTDLRPEVDPLTARVRRDRTRADLSPSDAAALERALAIGAAWGLRVVAVAAGPPSADSALREAYGAGADVLRVDWDAGDDLGAELAGDPRPLAAALTAAIQGLAPTVVLCGDRSITGGTGVLPALLADGLGAAQALGLTALAVDGQRLIAERRLDAGRRERLAVPRPAVCSIEAAGVRLRRGPLRRALSAATLDVPVVAAARVAPDPRVRAATVRPFRPRTHRQPPPSGATPRERLVALTGALVAHDPPVLTHPADADEAAGILLDYLRARGYRAEADASTQPA